MEMSVRLSTLTAPLTSKATRRGKDEEERKHAMKPHALVVASQAYGQPNYKPTSTQTILLTASRSVN